MKEKRIRLITSLLLVSLIIFSISGVDEDQNSKEIRSVKISEFTGILTFILIALATLILPLTYIHRFVRKYTERDTRIRKVFRSFNPFFKRFHLIIGIGALVLLTLHAYLTIDRWDMFLPIGLLMVWANILPGVLFYSNFFNEYVSNRLYQIHVSIIFRILIVIILYVGHVSSV